jgi:hypothetical protein
MTLREKIMEMVNDRRELLRKKIEGCQSFQDESGPSDLKWRYFLESWEDHIFNEFMYRNTKDLSGLATEWIIECRLIEAAREIQSYVMVLADVAGNEINNEIRKMLREGK